jgi:hypothetical protein
MSVGFFKPFPQKSVTLAFEHTMVKACGEFLVRCQSFGGHKFSWLFSLRRRHPHIRACAYQNSGLV